jgi:adenylate cyclase
VTPGFVTPARAILAAAAVALGCAMAGGLVDTSTGRFGLLSPLESATIDARFALRGPRTGPQPFCVVTVDDASLARRELRLDRRTGLAALVQRMRAAGARAVAIDALFSGDERVLPPRLVEDIDQWLVDTPAATDPPEVVQALATPRRLLSRVRDEARGDDTLARSLAEGEVVLGLHTGSRDTSEVGDVDIDRATYGQQIGGSSLPPVAGHVVGSLPLLQATAARVGVVTLVVDPHDRVARTVHAGRTVGQRVVMPFGVALAAAAEGVSRGQIAYDASAHALHLGERVVFADHGHRLWLNHRGPADTFCMLSAAAVLEGKDGGMLRDKVSVIAFHELGNDTVATPFAPQLPGATVHVTLANNLLDGDVLRPLSRNASIVVLVLFAALGALAFHGRWHARAVVRIVALLVVAVAWCVAAQLAFVSSNVLLPVAGPLWSLTFVGAAGAAAAWVTEGIERRRIRRAFAHYLNDDVIEELLRDPNALARGGERRELTVLFSDIRGFTTTSEEMEPLALVNLLNAYFTPMTRAVLSHRGLLDKYIGDAIMAVFGAPVHHERHVDDALECALAMHAALQALQGDQALQGRPLAIGVGINTGEMVVGNLGGADRFDYTVVGDAVNLASRIEGLTRGYGVFCLVGEATRQAAATRFRFREIDRVRVKGKRQTGALYEFLGDERHSIAHYVDVEAWEAGLSAYRAGRFDEARAALAQFATANENDVAAALLVRRMEALDVPPAGWDGVFEQRDK